LALTGGIERPARDLQFRAARHPPVESDHRPPPRPLRAHHPGRLARDVELRADLESLRHLARILDDEGTVETMGLADTADGDSLTLVHATASRRTQSRLRASLQATPRATRSQRRPPPRTPCGEGPHP